MNLSRGAIAPFTVVFAGLILVGLFAGSLPKVALRWPWRSAPLATCVDRIPAVSRLSPWKVAAIRIVAILVPLAVAVGVAIVMRPVEASGM